MRASSYHSLSVVDTSSSDIRRVQVEGEVKFQSLHLRLGSLALKSQRQVAPRKVVSKCQEWSLEDCLVPPVPFRVTLWRIRLNSRHQCKEDKGKGGQGQGHTLSNTATVLQVHHKYIICVYVPGGP